MTPTRQPKPSPRAAVLWTAAALFVAIWAAGTAAQPPGKAIVWQKAPAGVGEFVACPPYTVPPNAQRWGGRVVLGFPLGTLRDTASGHWQIVGSLYGRYARPIGQAGGLLWVRHVRDGHPDPQVSMLGLCKDMRIRKELPLRPAPLGACVGVENGGFWFLDEPKDMRSAIPVSRRRAVPPPPGWASLSEYGTDGKRKRRFRTDGKALPKGLIRWAAVDAAAAWLAVVKPTGISRRSGAVGYGESVLVRLDRASGKHRWAVVPMRPETTFLNFPKRILWVMRAGKDRLAFHQLDKNTVKASVAATVHCPKAYYPGQVTTDGKTIWVYAGPAGLRGFSLDGFKLLPAVAAKPPTRAAALAAGSWAAAGESAWFIRGDRELIELRDGSAPRAVDVTGRIKSGDYTQLAAVAGAVYLHSRGAIYRVDSGKGVVATIRLGKPVAGQLTFFLATDRRVWAQTGYRMDAKTYVVEEYAVSPDLTSKRKLHLPEGVFRPFSRTPTAVGDCLYLYVRQPTGKFLSIDGATGTCTFTDALPPGAGRPPAAARGRYRAIRAGTVLYGVARAKIGLDIVKWLKDGWQPVGRWPLGRGDECWGHPSDYTATRRYLYGRTLLGLFRCEWSTKCLPP